MSRREGEGAHALACGEGGQAGKRRQGQGAGRSGRTGCAGKLTGGGRWRRHPMGKVKQGAAPGCELPDGALQNENLNVFILSSYSCQLIFFVNGLTL